MAADLQQVTTYGDEAVLAMQAVLLTFTNIRGERFEQATTAILDMSAALGTSLQSAAIQVGKALNDPSRASRRSPRPASSSPTSRGPRSRPWSRWVTSRARRRLILKELETQFGGVAEAMAKTPSGQWTQAMNALGDALEHVGQVLTPYVLRLAAAVREAALAFQALSPEAKTTIVVIAGLAATLGPVLTGIGLMVRVSVGWPPGFAAMMGVAARLVPFLVTLAGAFGVVAVAMEAILALVGHC